MFSPVGKKKILLQQKFGLVPVEASSKATSPSGQKLPYDNSPEKNQTNPEHQGRLRQQKPEPISASIVAAKSRLEFVLSDPSLQGIVMRKILDATSRYRPERDAIVLKAFESNDIEYLQFRNNLYAHFWLTFSDEEFKALVDYYDPEHSNMINGYAFMKSFIRLNGIRKDRASLVTREKQEAFEKEIKESKAREELIKEKKSELAADFDFTAEIRRAAIAKLETAAKAYDPGHPSAPSSKAFDVNSLKPKDFREMLKLTFNLKVNASELGAILKDFKDDIKPNCDIPSSEFLKFFLRLGFDLRDAERQEQRKKQEDMDKKAEEERLKKEADKKKKLKVFVDYNFSVDDEDRAMAKLKASSIKYDQSATGSVSLEGFECEELPPLDFRELIRRVFNIVLTPAELGYVIQKYDSKKSGSVHCKTFLTEFLRFGFEGRHKQHIDQLELQRKLNEEAEKEHIEKMKSVQVEKVPYSKDFTDDHLQAALKKLREVAAFFDSERSGGMLSFVPKSLDLVQFKRGLKRTFNIEFSAEEMGAVHHYLDTTENGEIICKDFLTKFTTLGANERQRLKTEQLQRQKELDKIAAEEAIRKQQEADSKILYEVEYEFTPADMESAVAKMTVAATKYDAAHPAAVGLQGFEVKSMSGPQFKEIVLRTFRLSLQPKEVGALFNFFSKKPSSNKSLPFDQIDCGSFLKYFLRLGITERGRFHSEQIEKQRREDKEREIEENKKLFEAANRQTYEIDNNFGEEDIKSITEKLLIAAEKFDKSHPAAPSLEAFTAMYMSPGVFRENIKSIFGVRATPKEIAYLMTIYDKEKVGKINTKDFLIKFFATGKSVRDEKRKATLEKQRLASQAAKEEEELKLIQLIEKSDYEPDMDYTEEDVRDAIEKMTEASEKYDKMHPSAPNLDGFTGGPISPGAFRELMKRAFQVYLTNKQVGAMIAKYPSPSNRKLIDGKKFLIAFMKLGFVARARRKTKSLEIQRKAVQQRKQEEELKLRLALSRVDLDIPNSFSEADKESAMKKITSAAALYDTNAPGSVSLDSFQSKFLTPGMFREVVKRTFNILLSPEELVAAVDEFSDGNGNVDTNKFLVNFIKVGFEERDRLKAIEIDKQRRAEQIRQAAAAKKKKEADDKMNLSVSYGYSPEEKASAFEKLAAAAKKYDKSHPASMSLEGFEEKNMKPHVFREMLKRTFNFVCSAEELGSLVHHFDQTHSGTVDSHDFLVYFLKLGIAEREKEHKESLKKLREDAILREKFHEEKMAAQWAKAELNIQFEFTSEEKAAAIEKLTKAAAKFDPASPGPMGLTAFQASHLSPAVFREMLKRCFNLLLTNGELAALISLYDKDGKHNVNCSEFLVMFNALGFERRSQIRSEQIDRQRVMDKKYAMEMLEKQRQADEKAELKLPDSFTDEDLQAVLEKIRVLASNYDRSHPSAPSLQGFMGTDMKPNEFKQIMMRTFGVNLSVEEMSALVAYFPSAKNSSSQGSRQKNKSTKVDNASGDLHIPRISNRDFLTYFNRIQRDEQAKKHTDRINKERSLKEKEKKEQEELAAQAVEEMKRKLAYSFEDENSCVEKIKHCAREYAIDSAPYHDGIQGFKGPAIPPDKLRDLMYNIFGLKISFPEVGVLLSILDHSNLGVFDGPNFLNWFVKISRKEALFMLGETNEPVTLETLKAAGSQKGTELKPTTASATMKTRPKSTAKSSKPSTSATERTAALPSRAAKPPGTSSSGNAGRSGLDSPYSRREVSDSYFRPNDSFDDRDYASQSGNSVQSFSKATLSQSWYLPSISTGSYSPSLERVHSRTDSSSSRNISTTASAVRAHLEEIFSSQSVTALDQTSAAAVEELAPKTAKRRLNTAPQQTSQTQQEKGSSKLKKKSILNKSAPMIVISSDRAAVATPQSPMRADDDDNALGENDDDLEDSHFLQGIFTTKEGELSLTTREAEQQQQHTGQQVPASKTSGSKKSQQSDPIEKLLKLKKEWKKESLRGHSQSSRRGKGALVETASTKTARLIPLTSPSAALASKSTDAAVTREQGELEDSTARVEEDIVDEAAVRDNTNNADAAFADVEETDAVVAAIEDDEQQRQQEQHDGEEEGQATQIAEKKKMMKSTGKKQKTDKSPTLAQMSALFLPGSLVPTTNAQNLAAATLKPSKSTSLLIYTPGLSSHSRNAASADFPAVDNDAKYLHHIMRL